MRRSNVNAYNTFESYSDKKSKKNDTPYRTSATAHESKPPQVLQGAQQGGPTQSPLPSQVQQGKPIGMNPSASLLPPHVSQRSAIPSEAPSTLRELDSRKVYNLLTDIKYNTKDGIPMKFILYCSALWCHPCKLLQPKIEELSKESRYQGITFIKIDCSDPSTLCNELRNLLNIDAVPIIFSFIGGKQVGMTVGASISEIEGQCDQLANL